MFMFTNFFTVIFSWFAGLFYLPRIFVNLAMVPGIDDTNTNTNNERARLLLMARKLLRFTQILSVPAVLLGLWLWLGYVIGRGPGSYWMHAKRVVVVLALGYQHGCSRLYAKFAVQGNTRSHVWFRWFNEVPVLLLTAAVVLVVVKPF